MHDYPLTIVFYYHKTARYAANVLAGSLETHEQTQHVPLHFAKTLNTLVAEVGRAALNSKKVLVVWSFYSSDFLQMTKDLQQIKSKISYTNILHIAGGVHATAEPHNTLAAGFDFVAQGEGEELIRDIVMRLYNHKPLTALRGLTYQHDGQTVHHGKTRPVDLEAFPAFAFSHKKIGPIEITRGCIYACQFCQTPYINKARFRHRSIDNIIHHITYMRDLGSRDYRFLTPTALSYGSNDTSVNLDAIEHLLARTRETVGDTGKIYYGTFPSEVRPEHVSEPALRMLKRFVDNRNLIIGGQSGSDRLLEKTRRGHNYDDVVRAVKLCVQFGFTPNVDFLFGLPGETAEDREKTRNAATMLTDLGARIHTHTFMPLPGTPLKNECGGTVDAETEHLLEQLASKQQAYGPWQTQQRIAKELELLRIGQIKKSPHD